MLISLSWVREFVDLPADPAALAHRLTMAGLAVDAIEEEARAFEGIVVGHVLERVKHPNADKLSVCQVDLGTERLEIVCGAPNVDAGQHVAVARVGARVGALVMERRKIRGVVSNGMICSANELGLGEDHAGILVLDARARVGQSFADYLGRTDTRFTFDITPNRGDALSHFGVAREIAALYDVPLRAPDGHVEESGPPIDALLRVTIDDPAACPRYSARVVRNLRVGPSPSWMQDRLRRADVRPINNIVDVTNYVLLELGHPLHAFDYDRLAGHAIVVRPAAPGETFVTLDGKARTLRADSLLICDAERGVAVAGVMGGANSEIAATTTTVVIESAYFAPVSIRRTARHLGLATDASYHFERGADVENTILAVNRAAELMRECAGGDIARGVLDAYPNRVERPTIVVRTARVQALLGVAVPVEEMRGTCGRLGFEPQEHAQGLEVRVPSWRGDVSEEADVIEEIARVVGYDRFVPAGHHVRMRVPLEGAVAHDDALASLCAFLIARGYNEVVTNSLLDVREAARAPATAVRLSNPLSQDMAVLRPHPLPAMVSVLGSNARHGTRDARVFELCRTHARRTPPGGGIAVEDRFVEREWLVLALAGSTAPRWDARARAVDFYDLKGDVEAVLGTAGLDNSALIAYNEPENALVGAPVLAVRARGREIGVLGSVRGDVLRALDCEPPVYAAWLDAEALRVPRARRTMVAPPRFPLVTRDLAVIAPREVTADALARTITEAAASGLLRSVRVFDVFEGAGVEAGTRSVAFTLAFGADDRTLRDEEIVAVMRRVVEVLTAQAGFTIRS